MSDERYTLIAYQSNTPAGNDSHCHTYTPLTKDELIDHIIEYTALNKHFAGNPLVATWDLRILKGSMIYVDYETRQGLYVEAHDVASFRKM